MCSSEADKRTSGQTLSAGGTGGFLYWSLFYPIDVIKSAIMTDAINPKERKYTSFFDAGSKLLKEGGVKRLYAGRQRTDLTLTDRS